MLEALDLECRRGGRTLFRGLSFPLKGGELLRVGGANGSGKTSLLRILCGLLSPASGEVRWRGAPIQDLREEYSRELAYLGHAAALKDDLTPGENLRIAASLSGVDTSSGGIREALSGFQVPDLPVRKLSQGQKRRAALARLVARLEDELGERPMVLPNGTFFPDRFVGDLASVQQLVARLLKSLSTPPSALASLMLTPEWYLLPREERGEMLAVADIRFTGEEDWFRGRHGAKTGMVSGNIAYAA